MNRRASCVGTFEVFEAAHVTLRTSLAFSQPVNCIFWPIGMLNWLVAASKLHKHRETCCTAEWPFYSFLILWRWSLVQECLATADFSSSAFSQLVLCALRRNERFRAVHQYIPNYVHMECGTHRVSEIH